MSDGIINLNIYVCHVQNILYAKIAYEPSIKELLSWKPVKTNLIHRSHHNGLAAPAEKTERTATLLVWYEVSDFASHAALYFEIFICIHAPMSIYVFYY